MTADGTNEEKEKRRMGLESRSAGSLQRTQAAIHHGPDPSPLRPKQTGNHRNRPVRFRAGRHPIPAGRRELPPPGGIPLTEEPASGNQLRNPRQGAASSGRYIQTLAVLLRRSSASNPSFLGPS